VCDIKRLVFVIVVVSLLLAPLFVQRGRIEWVNASPSTDVFADATDGYLDSNGVVYSTYSQMSLGDWSNNAYSHCYVKFSLSGVSGTLSSATLNLYVYISYHDNNSYSASPLTNPGLGNCEVTHIADYGTLDTSDFSAVSIGNDPGALLSGTATPNVGYVSIDIRAAMQDDINHGRTWSTFMLRMSTITDGNSDNDYWVFYTSRDASPTHHPYVEYDLVHQGDLILTGNNMTTITGRLDINGSIIVEENATLVLTNAVVNFTQSDMYQYNVTLRNPSNGNPRLQAENSTITSGHNMLVLLYGNSTASASNLTLAYSNVLLYSYDSSVIDFSKSQIYSLYVFDDGVKATLLASEINYAYIMGNSHVSFSDSSLDNLQIRTRYGNFSISDLKAGTYTSWNYLLNCSILIAPGGYAPNVTLSNSQLNDLEFILSDSNGTISNTTLALQEYGSCSVRALDCAITYLGIHDSSTIWIVNPETVYYGEMMGSFKIYLLYYLDVHVLDSVGQNVSSANVIAFYSNLTSADSRHTDTGGWARLTLMEKMMNATGQYLVGNYSVSANLGVYSNDTTVNMTGNQQITLKLEGLLVPEFPQFLILPLLMMAIPLVVLVCKKRRESQNHISAFRKAITSSFLLP